MPLSRIAKRIILGITALGFPLVALTFCVGDLAYYADKMAPAPGSATESNVAPYDHPVPIFPEVQTEPNTCGFHSLSAIYTAYGLDSESTRLRFRLGVDKPVNMMAPDSTGMIHPDMFRVLAQDGFHTELVRPSSERALGAADAHLASGHPIVALIRSAGGGLHWVVVASYDPVGSTVSICDSLFEKPYDRPAEEFLTVDAHSLILVRPR